MRTACRTSLQARRGCRSTTPSDRRPSLQYKRRSQLSKMTLKIEKDSDGQQTTIRLIGHVQSEHLEELKAQIKGSGLGIVLDLAEVTARGRGGRALSRTL